MSFFTTEPSLLTTSIVGRWIVSSESKLLGSPRTVQMSVFSPRSRGTRAHSTLRKRVHEMAERNSHQIAANLDLTQVLVMRLNGRPSVDTRTHDRRAQDLTDLSVIEQLLDGPKS